MNRFRALPALLLAVTLLRAQETTKTDSVVDVVLKEGRENPKVMDHLDHLTNKIGPRLTGSDRLTQACEWARDQFKSFGIENARLEQWGSIAVGFNRGPWSGEMTTPEQKKLTCGTMAWTPGTNGPVEGHAATPDSTDLKGAWVLVPSRAGEDVLKKIDDAGAAGIIRSARGELIVTDGNHRTKWDRIPKRVTVYLIASQFKEVSDLLAAGKEVRLKFDIKNEFKEGPIPQYNVIADIPGTEKPDEFVIVGGHIDSWDGATGTQDNGTGVSTTLEAARLLMKAGAKPKRTIRFMLWGGEEQGLLGSYAWIAKNKSLMPKVSCVLVHDGGTNYVAGIMATKSMVPLFQKVFAPVMDLGDGMKFRINETRRLPYPIGSDHDAFLSAGVPGFFWNQHGRTSYNHVHHTQNDLFESAVPEYQKHSAMVIAVGAWGIANLDDLLPREGLPTGGEGHSRSRLLGVDTEEDGQTVTSVRSGLPAEKAGVKVGDKILKIGDKKVGSYEELRTAIRGAQKKSTLVILRDGKELTLNVEFQE